MASLMDIFPLTKDLCFIIIFWALGTSLIGPMPFLDPMALKISDMLMFLMLVMVLGYWGWFKDKTQVLIPKLIS